MGCTCPHIVLFEDRIEFSLDVLSAHSENGYEVIHIISGHAHQAEVS